MQHFENTVRFVHQKNNSPLCARAHRGGVEKKANKTNTGTYCIKCTYKNAHIWATFFHIGVRFLCDNFEHSPHTKTDKIPETLAPQWFEPLFALCGLFAQFSNTGGIQTGFAQNPTVWKNLYVEKLVENFSRKTGFEQNVENFVENSPRTNFAKKPIFTTFWTTLPVSMSMRPTSCIRLSTVSARLKSHVFCCPALSRCTPVMLPL